MPVHLVEEISGLQSDTRCLFARPPRLGYGAHRRHPPFRDDNGALSGVSGGASAKVGGAHIFIVPQCLRAPLGRQVPVLVAPILGWIGVALSGSSTPTNAMFGAFQMAVGRQLAVPPELLPR